jgi:hypothetical protein
MEPNVFRSLDEHAEVTSPPSPKHASQFFADWKLHRGAKDDFT